jgi:hypothetical protein
MDRDGNGYHLDINGHWCKSSDVEKLEEGYKGQQLIIEMDKNTINKLRELNVEMLEALNYISDNVMLRDRELEKRINLIINENTIEKIVKEE